MKVFISAQINEKDSARRAFALFESAGIAVTHDWTRTDDIGDKFKRPEEAGRRAKLDIDGVLDADVYVLLSDNREVGKGMYVELGAALALSEKFRKPDVFVVGPMRHSSIFYLHPNVRHFDTVESLIEVLQSGKVPV